MSKKTHGISTYPCFHISVEEPAFIKDPLQSDLGKKILSEGVFLMSKLGYEQFTFKKLALKINSTEASIYRYFENKHKLLIYYFLYYWHDIENRIAFATANIKNPETRLKVAIQVMINTPEHEPETIIPFLSLKEVITAEFVKVYFSKSVDEENNKGVFKVYKRVCHTLAETVEEINPSYPWKVPLISSVMDSIYFQRYYAEHLPSLTHKWKDEKEILHFFTNMIANNIKSKQE